MSGNQTGRVRARRTNAIEDDQSANGRSASIAIPQEFDFAWLLSFMRPRAVAGVERVEDDAYARALRIGSAVTVRLTPHVRRVSKPRLRIEASKPVALPALRATIARMLDVDAELDAFRAMASSDPILAPLVAARPGIRLIRFPDAFEGLVRGILGQQVSLAAAATTAARLVRVCAAGRARLRNNGRTNHGSAAPGCDGPVAVQPTRLIPFPTAAELASMGEPAIRAIGLTRVKAAALLGAAAAVAEGKLVFERVAAEGPAAADAALTGIPGVGPWTAAYVRMRGLGDRDAFPASDLGVLKALSRLLRRDSLDVREALRIAERWRPWRAYATLHLWNSL